MSPPWVMGTDCAVCPGTAWGALSAHTPAIALLPAPPDQQASGCTPGPVVAGSEGLSERQHPGGGRSSTQALECRAPLAHPGGWSRAASVGLASGHLSTWRLRSGVPGAVGEQCCGLRSVGLVLQSLGPLRAGTFSLGNAGPGLEDLGTGWPVSQEGRMRAQMLHLILAKRPRSDGLRAQKGWLLNYLKILTQPLKRKLDEIGVRLCILKCKPL